MVMLPATKPVDRIDASQLSYDRFMKEYAMPGRPLVITNSPAVRSMNQTFSVEGLKRLCGDRTTQLKQVTIPH
jgi:hypothetical protein